MASHGVGFDVTLLPLAVLITLVAGHHDAGFDGVAGPHRFKHVYGAHHVGCKCGHRLLVRAANQRLSGKVKNNVRPGSLDGPIDESSVDNITLKVMELVLELEGVEQTGVR